MIAILVKHNLLYSEGAGSHVEYILWCTRAQQVAHDNTSYSALRYMALAKRQVFLKQLGQDPGRFELSKVISR